MSAPSIKRHNHRVHPCSNDKKMELLTLLLTQNEGKSIFVVASDISSFENENFSENVTLINDDDLLKDETLRCELLISYDLPAKAAIYMVRLAHATAHALILLDPSEQSHLYPIETLLGRTLMQENISGFEPIVEVLKTAQPKPVIKEKPRQEFKQREERAPRDDKKPRTEGFKSERKPYDKDKKDFKDKKKPYAKDTKSFGDKKKSQSKFLGKDENGKAIFSGKSKDRNHRYDGTPKTEEEKRATPKKPKRTINIKRDKTPKEEK